MYEIKVTQYFDTYPEWTKVFAKAENLDNAKQEKIKACKQYTNRPLVSYGIRIIDISTGETIG